MGQAASTSGVRSNRNILRGVGRSPRSPGLRCGLLAAAGLLAVLPLACDRRSAQPAVVPPAVVSVSQPMQQEATEYIEYTGTTAPLESVEVRARVKGFLQSIHFQPRARVNKDDVLFKIDPSEYQNKLQQAQAQVAGNKARLEMAEFDLTRTEDLIKNNAATQYEYKQSIARRDEAEAALAAANANEQEAQLNVGYTKVTAPIAGSISRNMVDVGNLIQSDATLLATITNDDSIYAYFNISEGDVLRLKARTASSQPDGTQPPPRPPAYLGLMSEQGYPHAGWIDYVSPTLDKSTGTIEVRGCFPNADGAMLGGLFARIRIPVSRPRTALWVAETALGMDQGQRYLLIVNDKKIVEYRPVQVGLLDQGLRLIEEGIQPTDWVIVNGLQRVRPGVEVTPRRVAMKTFAGAATMPARAVSAVGTRPATSAN
jgi:multidrug efflux system membrane fusion protein